MAKMENWGAQARKTIAKAVPTVDVTTGNVTAWEIEVKYSLNGYQSTYHHRDEALAHDKPASEWTKKELLEECPTNQWERVFTSQYHSVVIGNPDAPQKDDAFDFRKMKDE